MLSVLPVGEVRVAEDSDFRRLKSLCDETADWKLEYEKNNTRVSTKNSEISNFKIVRVRTVFSDVSPEVLYDVLHDPDFRKTWDHSMLEAFEICAINPNNDIGYYALRSPPPLRNRDFVTQRSWLDVGKEKYIMNHSVNHEGYPPKKGYIRGISYLTGYLIRELDGGQCQFSYVAQSDPRGKLPAWVVNKATKIVAPKMIQRIHKACKSYPSWKSQHNPHLKPWLYPEQMTLPRLDLSLIKPLSAGVSSESLDESGINEDDVNTEALYGTENIEAKKKLLTQVAPYLHFKGTLGNFGGQAKTELLSQLEQTNLSLNQMTVNLNEQQQVLQNKGDESANLMLQLNELKPQLESAHSYKVQLEDKIQTLQQEIAGQQALSGRDINPFPNKTCFWRPS